MIMIDSSFCYHIVILCYYIVIVCYYIVIVCYYIVIVCYYYHLLLHFHAVPRSYQINHIRSPFGLKV